MTHQNMLIRLLIMFAYCPPIYRLEVGRLSSTCYCMRRAYEFVVIMIGYIFNGIILLFHLFLVEVE